MNSKFIKTFAVIVIIAAGMTACGQKKNVITDDVSEKEMTNIQELYDICSRENITIDFIDCPKCGAISLFGSGGCAIGIDSQTPARLLKERTAHEIGHCVKGAFYNRYATADNISQHEYRADKWAIENLIPKSELIKAIKKNLDSIYLLAQHFDVSEDFMIKACRYYGVYFG